METNERQKSLYSYIDTNVSSNLPPDSLAPTDQGISSGKAAHCVGFGCVSFHGRISNGTPGSTIANNITSQGFHLKLFRQKQHC